MTGEDAAVQRRVVRNLLPVRRCGDRRRGARLGKRLAQLLPDVAPLGHAREAQEAGLAELAQRVLAGRLRIRRGPPDLQQAEEVGIRGGEGLVRRLGQLAFLLGPFARIRDAEPGGKDEHVGQAALLTRLQEHAAQGRIQRQARQLAAGRGHCVRVVHGPQLAQQVVARPDGRADRRIEERKALDLAEPERLHAQDHLRQVGALDLRLGEARALEKILLGVEPDADAVLDAPGAAGALVGAALRHGLDRQALGARARVVAAHARQAGVDDVADPGQGDRGLGHVGRHDDAALRAGGEHALLLVGGHAAEQRQHLPALAEAAVEQVPGLANVALGRHEDQDVALAGLQQDVLDRAQGGADVRGILVVLADRPVADLDRIQAPGDFEDRRAVKMGAEGLGVDRGRGDEQLEIRPAAQQALQVAEQEVDVERALMRLVEDQHRVVAEQGIALDLGQQDAVGHELDARLPAGVVVEAHLAADLAPPVDAEFLGHAAGHAHRRHAPRLGAADAPGAVAEHLQAHLRQLGGLARAGLTRQHDHLVRPDRRQDVLAACGDGEVGGVADQAAGAVGPHDLGAERDFASAIRRAQRPAFGIGPFGPTCSQPWPGM